MPLISPYVIAVLGFGMAAAFPLDSLSGIATTLINTSSTDTAVPGSKDVFRPACLGRSYGYGLSSDSCADALLLINSSSTAVRTYGMRGTGDFDVTLPRRYISQDGKCMIDVQLEPHAFSGVASLYMIASGSFSIIEECVMATPSHQGGSIILGDGRLYSTVASSKSEVWCYGLIVTSIQDSCQNILDTMPVSTAEQTFGPWNDSSAMVKLPYILTSRDQRCTMTIDCSGLSDLFSWYEIWSVGVALNGICIRNSYGGYQTHLGLQDRLSISLNRLG